MSLSQDGRRVAFLAADGIRATVVRDGVPVQEYDQRDSAPFWPMSLSADGATLAWSVQHRNGAEVVVNGRRREGFLKVRNVFVSPDGRTVAFAAQRKEDLWFMVVNGQEGPDCDFVSDPVFSEDGRTVAYHGEDESGAFLRIGSRRLPAPERLGGVSLSPDGATPLYRMCEKGSRRQYLLWDGRRGESFDSVEIPAFSPDGRRIAYGAIDDKRNVIVAGDRTFETPGRVGPPVFSPDGRSLGYGALDDRDIFWRIIPLE